MVGSLKHLLALLRGWFARRARLEAENLLLRQQLIVLRRMHRGRLWLQNLDRFLLVFLYRLYPSCWRRSLSSSRRRWFAGIAVVSAPTGVGAHVIQVARTRGFQTILWDVRKIRDWMVEQKGFEPVGKAQKPK
jgi:hypothetical protein